MYNNIIINPLCKTLILKKTGNNTSATNNTVTHILAATCLVTKIDSNYKYLFYTVAKLSKSRTSLHLMYFSFQEI